MEYSTHNQHSRHWVHTLLAWSVIVAGIVAAVAIWFAYPKVFENRSYIVNSANIGLKDQIELRFFWPMNPATVNRNITITPTADVTYQWADSNQSLRIVPKDGWKLDQHYSISIARSENIFFVNGVHSAAFFTQPYPKVTSFAPERGAKEVVFDIEDPISVTFDRDIKDFKVRFVVDPPVELADKIDFAEHKVSLIPKGEFVRGQRYTVSVYIRHQQEGEMAFRKLYDTDFETKPLPPPVWDKNFSVRLEQARQSAVAKITTGKYIDINLKAQIMTIFENGKLLDTYMISTGKRGMETPQGSFQVRNKFPRAWSKKYGLFMPYWMAIVPSGDFGIHELPEWPSGYKEGQNHLGTPVSHGCVRLGVGPAARVYAWAEIGTPIITHY
ncbi:hypothetical protein EPO05_02630 [Patescibacteria group bacterium]|nr:MAG: hypothetical protein EPO05_02630 [Patescibacteria group bacterium]